MYIVLTDTLLKGLGLTKISEVLVLALVAGFSQDGQGEYYGSLSHLAEVLPMTKNTAAACLKSLTEQGWLEKQDYYENGVKFCHYRVSQKFIEYTKNLDGGIQNFGTGGIQNFGTHNKDIDSKKDKEKNTIPLPFQGAEFIDTWNTLLRQPKWRKKSEDALVASAKFLADYPEATAVKIMHNTIRNDWQGLFPPKAEDMKAQQAALVQKVGRVHASVLRQAKELGWSREDLASRAGEEYAQEWDKYYELI